MGSSQALVGLLGPRDPLLWGQQELMELWALLWLQPGNSWHSTCPSALVFLGGRAPLQSTCCDSTDCPAPFRAVPGEVVTCSPNLSLAPCFQGYAPQTTTESRLGLLPAPVPSRASAQTPGTPSVPALSQTKGSLHGATSRLAGWEGAPETTAKCHQDSELPRFRVPQPCLNSCYTPESPKPGLQNFTASVLFVLHSFLFFFFSCSVLPGNSIQALKSQEIVQASQFNKRHPALHVRLQQFH